MRLLFLPVKAQELYNRVPLDATCSRNVCSLKSKEQLSYGQHIERISEADTGWSISDPYISPLVAA